MSKLLQFWPVRILRESIAYLFFYLPVRFVMPLHLRLSGYKRSDIGTCTILAPPKQMQIILEGVTYLQMLDSEMFRRLTAERRYIFWYFKQMPYLQCRDVFGITDNFMSWGKEGVVACFVQCVLYFNLEHLRRSQIKNCKDSASTRCEMQKQVLEFLERYSFPSELVKQYRAFANDAAHEVSEVTDGS